MKIGIISDIHGDLAALHLAIKTLHEQAVDQIVCAGDLVDRGPQGDDVARTIQELQIPCIAGNHDSGAGEAQRWYEANKDRYEFLHTPESMLSDETIAFLDQLPKTLLLSAEGSLNVLLAHGTPWSDTLYVFPASSRTVYERIAKVAHSMNAGVVVLGHTHMPLLARERDVHIINPGSVAGIYTQGSRTCGVLTMPERTFEVLDIESGASVRPSRPVHEHIER